MKPDEPFAEKQYARHCPLTWTTTNALRDCIYMARVKKLDPVVRDRYVLRLGVG